MTNQPTKSWSIKTEYIPKAIVWLVNIFNCLAYDGTVKYEWTDMTWNRVSLKLVLEEAPDNLFGYIMLHPTYSLIEYFSRPEYYTNIPCDCGQYTGIFSRGTLNCMDVLGCERFYLCRLFTIDWFKPEIVTGQYNSHAGISNVIFPGGHGKWSENRKNSSKI